jgi:hypothetical protein
MKYNQVCEMNTAEGYGIGVTGQIVSTLADYNAGSYPIFSDRILNADQDTGVSATIQPNAGESYADFKTRLNDFLTAAFNNAFGVGNWAGGLCFDISDDGVSVLATFERLKLTYQTETLGNILKMPFRIATNNGSGKNGITAGDEAGVKVEYERGAGNTRFVAFILFVIYLEPELNYEEGIRLNAGDANSAQVR